MSGEAQREEQLEVPRGCIWRSHGVQLEGFCELQGECSWRLLVGLKSPGLKNSSFQVYYGLLL